MFDECSGWLRSECTGEKKVVKEMRTLNNSSTFASSCKEREEVGKDMKHTTVVVALHVGLKIG